MQKIFTIIAATLLTVTLWGQAPQKMSYQAVIRDATDNLVTNHSVGMRISILQGSVNGSSVYSEIQTPTTNANGLVSIEIGGGAGFDAINWANNTFFIKTETDPTGGNNYTITGTNQLLSVPYAMFAQVAGNSFSGNYNDLLNKPSLFDGKYNSLTDKPTLFDGTWATLTGKPTTLTGYGIVDFDFTGASTNDLLKYNGFKWVKFTPNYLTSYTETDPIYRSSIASGITARDTTNWTKKQDQLIAGTGISIIGNTISSIIGHFVGELYGGGVVFWVDHTGKHGLIVSMIDLSASQEWSNNFSLIGTTNDWDGASNTTAIIGQSGHTYSAAKLCADYTNSDYGTGIYSDWYLPSIAELIHIWNNFYEVQKVLNNDSFGSFTPLRRTWYWSSSESNGNYAWFFDFTTSEVSDSYSKQSALFVRAVRAF